MIGWLLFNAISAVFQPLNGGKGGEDGGGARSVNQSQCKRRGGGILYFETHLVDYDIKVFSKFKQVRLVYPRLPVQREITSESFRHVNVT